MSYYRHNYNKNKLFHTGVTNRMHCLMSSYPFSDIFVIQVQILKTKQIIPEDIMIYLKMVMCRMFHSNPFCSNFKCELKRRL